jgi:glycosyltransferase A (GT-A) superfamily protein (DUF2064 family)
VSPRHDAATHGVNRMVAVLASPLADPLALAMLEDVVELVEAMREVDAALVVPEGADARVQAVTWPAMQVVTVPSGGDVCGALDAVAALGADEAAVVCPDAPDLPPLLLGKLHSALTTAEVAVCPADGGGLVAFAVGATPPAWVATVSPGMDDSEVLDALRRVAPRRALSVGPGWHRIRAPYDVGRLDPGLEGWDATRALLSSG